MEDSLLELRVGDQAGGSLDIAQYCDLMEEVKNRIESVNQLMELPGITIRTRVEVNLSPAPDAIRTRRVQFPGVK